MKRLQFQDYESLSSSASKEILSVVGTNPKAILCLATGSTPKRLYELISQSQNGNSKNFNNVCIVKVDEWGGLEDKNPSTCEYYLQERLLRPLKIGAERYVSFKSKAEDQISECARIQKQLQQVGTIDLCILGLGLNGHLAFNEPSEKLQPHVHVARLTNETQQHSMLKSGREKPSWGYTLGMSDIMSAKKIMLLVSGESKVLPLQRLLQPKIETLFPASLLWLHPEVTIYSDVSL